MRCTRQPFRQLAIIQTQCSICCPMPSPSTQQAIPQSGHLIESPEPVKDFPEGRGISNAQAGLLPCFSQSLRRCVQMVGGRQVNIWESREMCSSPEEGRHQGAAPNKCPSLSCSLQLQELDCSSLLSFLTHVLTFSQSTAGGERLLLLPSEVPVLILCLIFP